MSIVIKGIDNSEIPMKTYAIVEFSSQADVTQNLTTNATQVKNALDTFPYEGGNTNTQDAIRQCTEILGNSSEVPVNPVIVILTDGDPTSCLDIDGKATREGAAKNKCYANGVIKGTAQEAAEAAANTASVGNAINIVPISILPHGSGTDAEALPGVNELARCAGVSGACEENQGLKVNFGQLSTIVDRIVREINCNGDDRTLQPTESKQPTTKPSHVPSEQPSISINPSQGPTSTPSTSLMS